MRHPFGETAASNNTAGQEVVPGSGGDAEGLLPDH